MHTLIELLISGLANGSVYAIMAVGLALVYGISKVFNWAYGSFFTWGAYVAWFLSVAFFHLSYPMVFVLVTLIMFFLGLIIERGIICPLRWKPNWQITTMMVTLGLALLLDNVALVVFGPHIKSLPPLLKGIINLGDFAISTHEAAMFLIAIFTVIVLGLFLGKTRQGMSMRAVSQDMVGAQIVGIPINKMFGYVFAISAVLAGIAAILLSPKYYISPRGGWEVLIKAFVIIVFGGLGSMRGTFYSAFILGILEALVGWKFGYMWVMVFWFGVLLGVLIIKPRGLFGRWE